MPQVMGLPPLYPFFPSPCPYTSTTCGPGEEINTDVVDGQDSEVMKRPGSALLQ